MFTAEIKMEHNENTIAVIGHQRARRVNCHDYS